MVNTIEEFKGLVSKGGGLARTNLFQVILPSIPGATTTASELNLLCSAVTLPGRQVQTMENIIGTKVEKIANGSVTDDVTFTFRVLNDYGVKKYFEAWQKIAYDPNTYQIGYKSDYGKQVVINQLKKGQGFPLFDASRTLFPRGPFPINITLDVNLVSSSMIVNQTKLFGAWPITINSIDLNNEQDGLVEYTVQLAYTKWI
jgi:hypothetical protein